jgi:hypothetical protein
VRIDGPKWIPDGTPLQTWKRFYEGSQAPFSWEPDDVVVICDGTLAQSTGPVRDPEGKVIARLRSVCGASPTGAG